MADLKGRVVLITGAGRGIGAATAKLLAGFGCRLVLVSRTADQLQAVRKEILERNANTEVLCLPADISNDLQISKLVDEITQHFGVLDGLINNAGAIVVKKFTEMSLQDWDKTIGINLRTVFMLSQAALPLLKKSLVASIVNISSLAGIQSMEKFPGFSAYTAAKMGLVGLSQVMALELKASSIRVNVIAAGAVDTQMLQEALPGLKTSTTPEDLAREILYFVDEDLCSGTTGELKVLGNR